MIVVAEFEDLSALLDYPMFIVTTAAGDARAGCLVGFATQISIDPPRFLVGLSERNHTFGVAQDAMRLVVHVLDEQASDLARLFGEETEDDVDKFSACDWMPGPDGVPVLTHAAAWFSGRIDERFDAGDHHALVFTVDAAEIRRSPESLLTFADVRDFNPGHDA
jgi:flavin reductase (DIM6/NTAB) family NADH-FMN oxidoreductase RutF